MPAKKKSLVNVPVVRREGRKLVGITEDQFKRISKLRKTNAGILAIAAVVSTALDLGLCQLEEAGGVRIVD